MTVKERGGWAGALENSGETARTALGSSGAQRGSLVGLSSVSPAYYEDQGYPQRAGSSVQAWHCSRPFPEEGAGAVRGFPLPEPLQHWPPVTRLVGWSCKAQGAQEGAEGAGQKPGTTSEPQLQVEHWWR